MGTGADRSEARYTGRVIVAGRNRARARSESVIGSGSVVEADAKIRRSIVWDGARIEEGAELDENIVASRAVIGRGASLGPGAVISQDAKIGDGAKVRAGVKVWPRKFVEEGSTLSHSLIWADRWTSTLFGSHGITGLASLEITPEFAARCGAAYGAFLGKGSEISPARRAPVFADDRPGPHLGASLGRSLREGPAGRPPPRRSLQHAGLPYRGGLSLPCISV